MEPGCVVVAKHVMVAAMVLHGCLRGMVAVSGVADGVGCRACSVYSIELVSWVAGDLFTLLDAQGGEATGSLDFEEFSAMFDYLGFGISEHWKRQMFSFAVCCVSSRAW